MDYRAFCLLRLAAPSTAATAVGVLKIRSKHLAAQPPVALATGIIKYGGGTKVIESQLGRSLSRCGRSKILHIS